MKKKPEIELRYYELPEREPVLALLGDEWVRQYTNVFHFHNLMELGVCRWGGGEMILNDRSLHYQDEMLTLIPQNCPHTTISEGDSLNAWEYLFFDPRMVLKKEFPDEPVFVETLVRTLTREPLCLQGEECRELVRLTDLLMNEYRTPSPCHDRVVYSLLASFLLLAAGHCGADAEHLAGAELEQILPAIEHIEAAYMNPLRIGDLAVLCSLSEVHLRRKFGEYLNMSPLEYLTLVRVRQGCELLQSTALSMTEVALRVGYPTVSTFNRNFQKIVGMSPYQYKKNSKSYQGQLVQFRISAKKGWQKRTDT